MAALKLVDKGLIGIDEDVRPRLYVAEMFRKRSFRLMCLKRSCRVDRTFMKCGTSYGMMWRSRIRMTIRDTNVAFRYTNIDPAAGVLTMGSDMGRLIIEHLSGGRLAAGLNSGVGIKLA